MLNNQRGFFIPGLPNPYFLLAAGIAIAVSFGLGYWKGHANGIAHYYEFKGRVEQAQEQIRIEQERRAAEAKRLYDNAQAGWAASRAELDRLKSRGPIIRVQPAKCPAGALPANASAATGANEATKEPGLGAEGTLTVEQCEQRVNLAIEDAAQVVWLQDWLIKEHRRTGGTK